MADFGAWLRRARERAGVTVEQIAATTKVMPSRIRALERNDLRLWPGGIFRRGFVRSYAELVGLDPDDTVTAFLQAFPDEESELVYVPPPGTEPLRLILVEDTVWWRGIASRAGAAATDFAAPFVLALPAGYFGGLSFFWVALAVLAVLYVSVGTLALGTTPGLWMADRARRPWRRARRPQTPASEAESTERHPDPPLEREVGYSG